MKTWRYKEWSTAGRTERQRNSDAQRNLLDCVIFSQTVVTFQVPWWGQRISESGNLPGAIIIFSRIWSRFALPSVHFQDVQFQDWNLKSNTEWLGRWNFASGLVCTVFEKKDALKDLFDYIVDYNDEFEDAAILVLMAIYQTWAMLNFAFYFQLLTKCLHMQMCSRHFTE